MKALEEIDRADLCDNLSPNIDSLAKARPSNPFGFQRLRILPCQMDKMSRCPLNRLLHWRDKSLKEAKCQIRCAMSTFRCQGGGENGRQNSRLQPLPFALTLYVFRDKPRSRSRRFGQRCESKRPWPCLPLHHGKM